MDRAAACRQLFFREKPFACHDSLFIRTLTEIVQKRYTRAPLTPDGPPPLPSAENARVQGPPGSTCHPPRHGIWLSAYDPGGPDQPQNLPCQRGSLAWEWMDHYPAIQTPPEQCRFGRGSPSFAWGHCPRFHRTGGYSPLKRLTDVHRSERIPSHGIRRIRAESRRQNPGQRRDAQRLLPAAGDQQRRPADGFAR